MNKKLGNEDKDYYSYFQRGNVRLVTKKYDDAIEDYDKAIKLEPEYAPIYNFRGYAYELKGNIDHAIINYNKAIALKNDYAEAYGNRGVAYGKKEDFDRAIENLNKAIELNEVPPLIWAINHKN